MLPHLTCIFCPHVPAAALGMLPPAASIASVPLMPSLSQPSLVSWASTTPNTSTTWSYATNQWPHNQLPAQAAPSHAGLTLSPAAETFPKRLVDKVRSGQFTEMKELLADNMSLLHQLETVSGVSATHMLGPARPRLREVASLPTWCYCFLGYVAMQTSDPTTRDQLAYARLLIKEAQRHGGLGWLDYDRAFRQQVAADPTMRWNTLIPGLQASTILGQRQAGSGIFCTLCRQVDHTRAQCALACLEPAASTPSTVTTTSAVRRKHRGNFCISWNKGACIFPIGECIYKHECPVCRSPDHKAKDCARLPESSPYRIRLGPARTRQPRVTPTSYH